MYSIEHVEYCYQLVVHVVTGDLNIIVDFRIQSIVKDLSTYFLRQ